MTSQIINGVTVLTADEGKDLYNNYLECNAGKECWLGYVHYDKNGNLLNPPYLLTQADFTEIDEEEREEPDIPDMDNLADAPTDE